MLIILDYEKQNLISAGDLPQTPPGEPTLFTHIL